jgi:hypothetical protein
MKRKINKDYNGDYGRSLMIGRFVREKPSVLDEPIAEILTRMNENDPDSEEYQQWLTHLERLYRLKAETRRARINPDTWAIVAGNLLGILIIVAYEQKHVMVSKGLGFVIRARDPHISQP